MPARSRLARLRRLLEPSAGLLVTHLPNLRYLVGFTGSVGALLVTRREALFFTASLYRVQARAEVFGARVQIGPGDPLKTACEWCRRRHRRHVLYEADRLTAAQLDYLRRALGPRAQLTDGGRLVERLRAVKEEGEIARLQAAQELTARVLQEVLPRVRPGVRELDLAAEIDYQMKLHGASGPAFETIVASGARAALPHGRASRKRLERNELVIFDLGAILNGYCGDMTRTVFLGRPPARVKRIYGAVQAALEGARKAVRGGVPAARVDATARRILTRRGFERFFVHGTGHGLGLEIHEDPRVGSKGEGRLVAGNVVTLEPGVYLPGWGGIRIEDVVVVRPGGSRTLTPLSTELICL